MLVPQTTWQGCLPPALNTLADSLCNHFQIDKSLAIPAILGICAASAQSKFQVKVVDNYTQSSFNEPLSLFIIGIADSSERKSPLFKWVKAPLEEIISEYNINHKEEYIRFESKQKTITLEVKKLRRKVISLPDGSPNRINLEERILTLEKELAKKVPPPMRLLLQDATAISAAEFMQNQQGNSLTIADAEGGSFDAIWEDHRLMELLLSGFSNETISFERSSRASVEIRSPHASICILTQRAKLETLAKRKNTWDEGFMPRSLVFLAQPMAGMRNTAIGPNIPEEATVWWKSRLQFLFDSPFYKDESGITGLHTLQFSAQSAEAWRIASSKLEEMMSPSSPNYHLRAWLGKMGGVIARLAAIFHLFESNDPVGEPIPMERVHEASNLVFALQPYMREVYNLYFPVSNDAETAKIKIINWLHRNIGTITFFKFRDMYRDLSLKSDAAHLACSHLVNIGVLVVDVLQLSDTKVGRKGTPVYGVNYNALHRFYPIF